MGFWDDAEVIHVYTRAQAIEDGELVDVTEMAQEAGFRAPVAMTRAAWVDCVEWPESNAGVQDEKGRLWDVLWMGFVAARMNKGSDRLPYQLLRVPNTAGSTRPKKTTLVLSIGPGDDAEPVFTILLPGED